MSSTVAAPFQSPQRPGGGFQPSRRFSLTQQTGLLQCAGGAQRVTRPEEEDKLDCAAAASAPVTMPSGVKVIVRMRPPLPSERDAPRVGLAVDAKAGLLAMTHMRREYSFGVDGVLREGAGQQEVYDTTGVRTVVDCVLRSPEGLNATIFAYGCTGGGKTFTMQGGGPALEAEGVVPRVLRQMLAHAGATDGCRVRISVFEIYQEKLRDLLVPSSSSVGPAKRKSFGSSSSSARGSFLFGGSNGGSGPRASFAPPTNADHNRGSGGVGARDSRDLPIREDARGNIVVPGLREVEVTRYDEFAHLYQRAHAQRRTADTKLNAASSRSHAVLLVKVVQQSAGGGKEVVGKVHLIDLAGSERNSKTGNGAAGAAADARLRESSNINTSLFVLGKVIDALNAGEARVPFRDSKLTRLLQDSLGGRALALMICCVAPTQALAGETCHALGYASKARAIVKNRRQSLYPDGSGSGGDDENEDRKVGAENECPVPTAVPQPAAAVARKAAAPAMPARVPSAASTAASTVTGPKAGPLREQSGGGGGKLVRPQDWRAGRVAPATSAAAAAAVAAAAAAAAPRSAAATSSLGGAKRLPSSASSSTTITAAVAALSRVVSTSKPAAAIAAAAAARAPTRQGPPAVRMPARAPAIAPTAPSSSSRAGPISTKGGPPVAADTNKKRKLEATMAAIDAANNAAKKLKSTSRSGKKGGKKPAPAMGNSNCKAPPAAVAGGVQRGEMQPVQPVPAQLLSPGGEERAKDMIVAGRKAEKQGNVEGALRFYQGAQQMLPHHQKLGQKIQALQARLQQAHGRRRTRSSSSFSFEEQEVDMDWAAAADPEGDEEGGAAAQAAVAVAAAVVRYRPSAEPPAAPMEEDKEGEEATAAAAPVESLHTLHQEAKGVLEAALLETLNAGSKVELLALHGIGPKRAQMILEVRAADGPRPFRSLQDLVTMKILPAKTLAALDLRG